MARRSYLRTSDIARAVGAHPNTVRLYEEWGFLPPIPRSPAGYRMYTEEPHALTEASECAILQLPLGIPSMEGRRCDRNMRKGRIPPWQRSRSNTALLETTPLES
ncbi:MAG: MerR family DNA-binding transcriptional regulator [Anaerolineae bacterium]|nr:MerR family DNA-binding transcriptional regulator [Anaerolineae bacterium]